MRLGRFGRWLAPGYGWCLHCGTPWRFVREHVTNYGHEGHGCFPLCEKCWSELATAEARLPFYRQLWGMWMARGVGKSYSEWQQIEIAVRAEVTT